MDRSAAGSLIYNTLSFCYVSPDEKAFASIATGEWIKGVREASHLLDEDIFDDHLGAIEQAVS